jgi:hypothetical protein
LEKLEMVTSYAQKLATAAGAASLAAVPMAADAAVVTVNTTLTLDLFDLAGGGPIFTGWDIDGVGGPDLLLFGTGIATVTGGSTYVDGNFILAKTNSTQFFG